MSEEKLDAKMQELGGTAKELVGKATGDKEVETEGQVDQVKGKVKAAAEDVKDAISGVIKGLRN
ncbi:CsbD family protein [Streptococcus sp. X16XC17]|uniref:CsbD family protein n=1 Tax=unclassified Streptococcus TaxID=2608887 RepID=UPI00066FD7A9|nr:MULTISPECIES: CsbD family protein [unclassified Streptococcus]TCD45937.1 CsbD family protein [Streptococcus sp. X16XC17]